MASFAPFKDHILNELDALADRYGLRGPFLDAGCGRGDVAMRLARRGWDGVALDMSDVALDVARQVLSGTPGVQVVQGDLAAFHGGPFQTVVMLDVLEHIEGDRQALAVVAGLQPPGGHLVLTVPTHPNREWRWDDDLYGHVRRYDPEALRGLLAEVGYQTIQIWDLTFPVLWAMRRAYTVLKRSPPITGTAGERTRVSTGVRAWDLGFLSWGVTHCLPWGLLFAWMRRNRHRFDRGHEAIVLARRIDESRPAID